MLKHIVFPLTHLMLLSTIDNKKKPSLSTELLCGADEIRTRDLRRDRPAF